MEEIDGDAPAQRQLREGRRPVYEEQRLRRTVYFLFLFQVVMKKSGAYDEESNNGADAGTRHARRERPALVVGNASLSPPLIGWVCYKFTQPPLRHLQLHPAGVPVVVLAPTPAVAMPASSSDV